MGRGTHRGRVTLRTRMLLREYIRHALYVRGDGGYFGKHVVGGLTQAIDFAALKDEAAYRRRVADVAAVAALRGSAWLTPSEVFTPHYGRSIARSIIQRHRHLYPGEPLQIIEVGGGNATFATDVLGHVRQDAADLFGSCRYVMLEISERLAGIQRERLRNEGFEDNVEVVHRCALEWAQDRSGGSSSVLEGPWHIAMLEVLDNLPHDKVRVRERADGSLEAAEALVVEEEVFDSTTKAARLQYTEDFRPLQEATVRQVLESLGLTSMDALHELQADIAATEGAGAGAGLALGMHGLLSGLMSAAAPVEAFIPTGSQRLLGALCQACPEHQFTIADFSWLPPQPSGAILAPVVQTQRGGHTIDMRGDYLRNPGEADILFPTHFGLLARLVGAASKASRGQPVEVSHVSTADFMRRHHDVKTTTTRDGFNPLLDDFVNTRILWTGGDEM